MDNKDIESIKESIDSCCVGIELRLGDLEKQIKRIGDILEDIYQKL